MERERLEEKLLRIIDTYGIDDSATNLKVIKNGIKAITIDSVSLSDIRAALLATGKVLEENLDLGYYLAIVNKDMNRTAIAANVENNTLELLAYSKEGLFNKRITEKAIKTILDALSA